MLDQGWLGMIKVSNIVLGRIFSTALVEQIPHRLLDCLAVVPFRNDVVLMKYVAEEMPIIELVR